MVKLLPYSLVLMISRTSGVSVEDVEYALLDETLLVTNVSDVLLEEVEELVDADFPALGNTSLHVSV